MNAALEKLFTGKPVLCDGAMGTMLYSCGVFINRCDDELNVTQPEMVRSVHEQYLLAGAEVIETNTFGANSFRLEHFGLRDKVREINLAGASLARQCVTAIREKQATDAYVAGAGFARREVGALRNAQSCRGAGSVCRTDCSLGRGRGRSADPGDDDVSGRSGAGDRGGA
jgi:methionine synthase I (cobalamin-dependent)